MRRIKSAPANICSMSNNKKVVVSQKENIAALTVSDQNEYNNFKDIKSKKKIITTTSNVVSDSIFSLSSLNYEENFIIAYIICYLSENIIKKDKLKNLQSFLIETSIRFLITYIIHHHDIIINIGKILQIH
jgi:hypothetical protein